MKKFIFSLLLGLVGLISFSNAGQVQYDFYVNNYLYQNSQFITIPLPTNCTTVDYSCTFSSVSNVGPIMLEYSKSTTMGGTLFTIQETDIVNGYNFNGTYDCSRGLQIGLKSKNSGFKQYTLGLTCILSGDTIGGGNSSCPECEECEVCPEVDTGAILSGYIAIEDITTNYCVSNDLCPEMSGGNSAIYINDIRHESMPFINIRIPEEIERDYNYTGNNTQLDINVEGYGYDQEKMQNMINTQYYTPTSEEMSSLIGKIADFLPLIAIALLVIRIRRVLKKVFRF